MCAEKEVKKTSSEQIEEQESMGQVQCYGEDCCQQLARLQDKYTYALADLNNFRQRVDRERAQWVGAAQIDIIKKLLPIVDDFDRALQDTDTTADIAGFGLIYKSLMKVLTSIGVEVMTDVMIFDPAKHDAIMQVDAPNHTSGDIVDVLEKGYMFNNEVIRPAKVTIAR